MADEPQTIDADTLLGQFDEAVFQLALSRQRNMLLAGQLYRANAHALRLEKELNRLREELLARHEQQ